MINDEKLKDIDRYKNFKYFISANIIFIKTTVKSLKLPQTSINQF